MKQELISWFRRAFLRHGPRRYAVMQPRNADRKYDDHPGELTDRQIAAHLSGQAAYAVPHAEAGLGHLLAFDIDAGGTAAARALLDAAATQNLWAFAQVDDRRSRGYVWLPFADLTNADRLHALGEQILAEVRPQTHGWRIENRATAEDTRLPFARHAWTGQRGVLLYQPTSGTDGTTADLDTGDPGSSPGQALTATLEHLITHYRENPTEALPPPPAPRERSQARPAVPQGQGVTIASYNASTDLVALLDHYGARPARGRGARLFFCPLHTDDHASLIVSKDGTTCHCYSKQSDCPLSGHQHDAFNLFCLAERLTPQQALRRLNGLPDEPDGGSGPEPKKGAGGRNTPRTPRQSPPAAPGEVKEATVGYHPTRKTAITPVRPLQARTEAAGGRRAPATLPSLPKSARRVLEYLREQPGDYYRGKYTLARALDLDPSTVKRSLRRLETEGLVQRTERGREGQTDIYRLTERRPEGGQTPPTEELEIITNPESLKAERGGSPETSPLATTGEDGAYYGPGGAVVYPGGAAYVPPEAERWYAATVAATLPEERDTPIPAPEAVQAILPAAEPPTPPLASRTVKRRKRQGVTDPGKLQGRIIAATRKAEKLEKGNASQRQQARAIRRSLQQLQRQLTQAQAEQEATWYSAEACDRWNSEHRGSAGHQEQHGGGAPPLSSLSPAGPDVAGLVERLRARKAKGAPPLTRARQPCGHRRGFPRPSALCLCRTGDTPPPALALPLSPPRSPRGRGVAALHPVTHDRERTMTTDTKRIAELNDLCRKAMGLGGRLVITEGIAALSPATQSAIREKVETFNDFTGDNDPYGERDFGAFEHEGQRIFWKIDYYAPGLLHGSENPADPAQTVRVLTILLASEY